MFVDVTRPPTRPRNLRQARRGLDAHPASPLSASSPPKWKWSCRPARPRPIPFQTMSQPKKIFGTDGVRGTANVEPVTAETALKLGRAAGHVFKNLESQARGRGRHKIVIGKDTRLSGYMLENALSSGILSMGVDVLVHRPAADARRGLRHAQPARRRRHRHHRLAQSLRRQRHQVLPRRRLQARRQDRSADREPGLQRRDRKHPPDRRGDRQGGAHRRRAGPLHRICQGLLSRAA